MQEVHGLVERLRAANYNEREGIKEELLALCRAPGGAAVRDQLDSLRRGELLEVQWEIEEVLERSAPPKPQAAAAPPPTPKPEEKPDPNRPLTSKDLTLVYDDPRGLLLHKSKVGDRWFATQVDPRTQQPQTFELHPQEVAQLKQQLAGSPYWVLGSGALAAPAASPKAPPARPPGR
ncbi:MAG: hypothetical protein FJ102_24815 [Deltaproteobacteria bacterium]|nr:hypothetical protein [Deltaproteobacteria bacterium]